MRARDRETNANMRIEAAVMARRGLRSLRIAPAVLSLLVAVNAGAADLEESGGGASSLARAPHDAPLDEAPIGRMSGLASLLEQPAPPAEVDADYREILDSKRWLPGSLSWGNTSNGELRSGRRIEEAGAHHYVLSAHRGRTTRWGTDALVEGVLRAAREVSEKFPDVATGVGNFSYERGGDIPWSVSHNSGRDADIAFFFRDAQGRSVRAPTLLRIGSDGRSVRGRNWTLDVPASWAFIEALIRDEAMRIQWVFVSEPIRARLLEYAASVGAEPEVMDVARRVLRQPANAAPHDDHFHLRVHCALVDRLEGCVEWGPRRPDLTYDDVAVRARVRSLVRGVLEGDREQAVRLLEGWEPREGADLIAEALSPADTVFQARLAKVVSVCGGLTVTDGLVRFLRDGGDPLAIDEAFRALRAVPSALRAPGLVAVATDAGVPVDRALRAVEMLSVSIDSETIPALVEALPSLREELVGPWQTVLRRFTLHRPDEGLSSVDAMADAWRAWLRAEGERLPGMSWPERRVHWFNDAFDAAGFAIGSASEPDLVELIRAVSSAPEELAWNADRRLSLTTSVWLPSGAWDGPVRANLWRARVADQLASSND